MSNWWLSWYGRTRDMFRMGGGLLARGRMRVLECGTFLLMSDRLFLLSLTSIAPFSPSHFLSLKPSCTLPKTTDLFLFSPLGMLIQWGRFWDKWLLLVLTIHVHNCLKPSCCCCCFFPRQVFCSRNCFRKYFHNSLPSPMSISLIPLISDVAWLVNKSKKLCHVNNVWLDQKFFFQETKVINWKINKGRRGQNTGYVKCIIWQWVLFIK